MKLRAFTLLEVMLAVGIFSMGVLGLGYSVNNCLNAESLQAENRRARLALANRMAEIEAGAVKVSGKKTEELKGLFGGMKLTQSRVPLSLKNEKKETLDSLSVVNLEVSWSSGGQEQAKVLSFYQYGQN